MCMKNVPSINLLKKQEKRFIDKFIRWALTVGRLLVIVTETVALSAFLYRFSLDRQLVDLHDEIEQKQAIVKLLKKNEDKYRNFQERLATIAQVTSKTEQIINYYTQLLSFIPQDLILHNVTVSHGSLKIDATALSVEGLRSFIKSLRDHPSTASVSLDKIEHRTSQAAIVVGITANVR